MDITVCILLDGQIKLSWQAVNDMMVIRDNWHNRYA